jgi:hypothetical protein
LKVLFPLSAQICDVCYKNDKTLHKKKTLCKFH